MGLTQAGLAEAVGVDSVSLRRWELGLRGPKHENLERLAAAFETSESELWREAAQAFCSEWVPCSWYRPRGARAMNYEQMQCLAAVLSEELNSRATPEAPKLLFRAINSAGDLVMELTMLDEQERREIPESFIKG